MSIDMVAGISRSPTPISRTDQTSSVDYHSFLQLLVAQLKHQDPTSPADSTQLIAQLAAFSNVEQSVQANQKLDKLIKGSQLTHAASLLGKEFTSSDGSKSGWIERVSWDSQSFLVDIGDGNWIDVESGSLRK